jgi:hypothetical protein
VGPTVNVDEEGEAEGDRLLVNAFVQILFGLMFDLRRITGPVLQRYAVRGLSHARPAGHQECAGGFSSARHRHGMGDGVAERMGPTPSPAWRNYERGPTCTRRLPVFLKPAHSALSAAVSPTS